MKIFDQDNYSTSEVISNENLQMFDDRDLDFLEHHETEEISDVALEGIAAAMVGKIPSFLSLSF